MFYSSRSPINKYSSLSFCLGRQTYNSGISTSDRFEIYEVDKDSGKTKFIAVVTDALFRKCYSNISLCGKTKTWDDIWDMMEDYVASDKWLFYV